MGRMRCRVGCTSGSGHRIRWLAPWADFARSSAPRASASARFCFMRSAPPSSVEGPWRLVRRRPCFHPRVRSPSRPHGGRHLHSPARRSDRWHSRLSMPLFVQAPSTRIALDSLPGLYPASETTIPTGTETRSARAVAAARPCRESSPRTSTCNMDGAALFVNRQTEHSIQDPPSSRTPCWGALCGSTAPCGLRMERASVAR